MGSKNKLKKFSENNTFKNLIQPTRFEIQQGFSIRGRWSEYFGNFNPIVLELGCGKGEYTLAIAKKNPRINCIGIDIKGARLWKGAKSALEEEFFNVTFIRTQIELVDMIFEKNEISEIWITFPDPQIKYKRTKHCLTSLIFLKKYHYILKKGGIVNLKTDSEFVYGYTLGLLKGQGHNILYAYHDVYSNTYAPKQVTNVKTFYEKQYLEKKKAIKYIKFNLNF